MSIKPFIKWAGGKRLLLNLIKERMPLEYNNYIEPFVGGGSLLFELQPKLAIINDINTALIHTYRIISSNPDEFIELINEMDLFHKAYYERRFDYNEKLAKEEYDIELAALFVFLNKHCFNGLYRVNRYGSFNVPFNKSYNKSIDEDNIKTISKYLKSVDILNTDFEKACNRARNGDFIFFDSPYYNTFSDYNKDGFSEDDHIRLANLYKSLTDKDCYCMLTNSNTDFIKDLYRDYNISIVDVKRNINRDASNRKGKEVIITNYENSTN